MKVEELVQKQFEHNESWGALAFVLASAERVKPVIEEFASEETKNMYQDHLDKLWKYYLGEELEMSNLIMELEDCPEASEDDSLKPEYYVMRALGMLFFAINIANRDEIITNVLYACTAMQNLCSDIDSFVVDAGERNKPSLEKLEIEIQKNILNILNTTNKQEITKKIIEETKKSKDVFYNCLPSIRKVHGWN